MFGEEENFFLTFSKPPPSFPNVICKPPGLNFHHVCFVEFDPRQPAPLRVSAGWDWKRSAEIG